MPSCACQADIHLCEVVTLCAGCIVLRARHPFRLSPFVLLLAHTSVLVCSVLYFACTVNNISNITVVHILC